MALQAQGKAVAMTGDGVNDAPALKTGHGRHCHGEERQQRPQKRLPSWCWQMTTSASIVAAVREGRTVYDNIKKVISWTLPTNVGEAMPIVIALLLGYGVATITAIQILWVSLITAVTLGIALASEPTEQNTMRRPPPPPGRTATGGTWVWRILLLLRPVRMRCIWCASARHAIERGYNIAMAQTMATNTLVAMEIFSLCFSVRNIYGTSLTWQAVRGTSKGNMDSRFFWLRWLSFRSPTSQPCNRFSIPSQYFSDGWLTDCRHWSRRICHSGN